MPIIMFTRNRQWSFTKESPLSAAFVQRQHPIKRHGDEVEFRALASSRLEDKIALLCVEREKEDPHRAVSDGQLKLARPDTQTVGGNSYQVLVVATRIIVLRTDTVQHTYTQGTLRTASQKWVFHCAEYRDEIVVEIGKPCSIMQKIVIEIVIKVFTTCLF